MEHVRIVFTYQFLISADSVHVLFFLHPSIFHILLHLLLPLLLLDFLVLSNPLLLLLVVRLGLDLLSQGLLLLQLLLLHLFLKLHVLLLDLVFSVLRDLLDDPKSILSSDDLVVSLFLRAHALVGCVPAGTLVVALSEVNRLVLPTLVSGSTLDQLWLWQLKLVDGALVLSSLVVLYDPEDIVLGQMDGLEGHVLTLLNFSLDSELPQ